MIKANIYDKKLVVEEHTVADSVKFDTVEFTFPDNWNGYTKTAVFKAENGEIFNVILDKDNPLCVNENECYIPHEVIKSPCFYLSVFGVNGDSIATTTQAKVGVLKSGYGEGDEPKEPTPTEYQQLVKLANQTKEIAQSVRDDADNGVFKGEKGDTGEVTLEYAGNTFASIIKNTVSGSIISVSDVSTAEHELKVNVSSKNLLDIPDITVESDSRAWYYKINGRYLLKPGVYTVSANFEQLGALTTVCVSIRDYDEITKILSDIYAPTVTETGKCTRTITIPETSRGIQIFVFSNASANEMVSKCVFTNFQIERGTTETEYTPYVEDLSSVEVIRYGKNLSGKSVIHKYDYSKDYMKCNPENAVILSKGTYRLSGTALPIVQFWDVKTKTACLADEAVNYNTNHYYKTWEGFCLSPASVATNETTVEIKKTILITMACASMELTDLQIEFGTNKTDYESPAEPQTKNANGDGITEGLTSIFPYMLLMTDTDGVIICLEYNADTKRYIDNRISSMIK